MTFRSFGQSKEVDSVHPHTISLKLLSALEIKCRRVAVLFIQEK